MSKQINRTAEIKVHVSYADVNNIMYEALCYVTVNSSYEVEGCRFSIIEAFDEQGDFEPDLSKQVLEQLESMAAAKALEKVESVDFEKEAECE